MAPEPPRDEEVPDLRETQISPTVIHVGISVPEAFGDYVIERPIASGGMGVVFRAWSRSLERAVAIKVLKREHDPGSEYHERFLREAKALARLDHPNIVRVYEVGWIGELPFLAMEYVVGEDLLAHFRRQTFLPERLRLFRQILGAVAVMHEAGVIHRDLKPDNAMVTEDGQVKIMDFGLARLEDGARRLTETGTAVGTPYYMSPEQFETDPDELDRRTDVYSLGVILYELLTDRVPFGGATLASVYHQLLHSEPELPGVLNPEVSPELEAVCLRAMSRAREDRFGSVGEMIEAFGEAMNPPAPIHHTVTLVRRSWRRSRAVRLGLAAGAIVLAFALLGLGTVSLLGSRREGRIEELVVAARTESEAGRHERAAELLAEARGAGGEGNPLVAAALEELALAWTAALVSDARRLAAAGDLAGARRKEAEAAERARGVEGALEMVAALARDLERTNPDGPRSEEAERLLAEAKALHKGESSDHVRLLELVEGAIAAEPSHVEARNLRVHCLDHLGREAEALEELSELLRLDAGQAHVYRDRRGDLLKDLREYALAEEEYGLAIDLAPEDCFDPLDSRAYLRYRRHDHAAALLDAERLIASTRAEAKYRKMGFWVRALVCVRTGDLEAAAADVGRLEADWRDSFQALHARTYLELALGRRAEALASARRFLEHHPRNGVARTALAVAAIGAGRFDEAAVALAEASQAGGPEFDLDFYYRSLGLVAEVAGDRPTARLWFEMARADHPDLPGIDDDLARVR